MTNGNSAAFARPIGNITTEEYNDEQVGLTKREYFAAMCLQGMLANPSELLTEIHNKGITKAQLATAFADCLIDALNEEQS